MFRFYFVVPDPCWIEIQMFLIVTRPECIEHRSQITTLPTGLLVPEYESPDINHVSPLPGTDSKPLVDMADSLTLDLLQ